MPEDRTRQQHKNTVLEIGPISWWSWRPGIRPRNALAIGGLIACAALLLAGIGLVTLVLGILDSVSPPLQAAGVITGHTTNSLDGQPHLTIRLHAVGFPSEVSPAVSSFASHAISNGDHILIDYSPHLHVLYALEDGGQRFPVPGSSVLADALGSLAWLLIGGALFPYPALLFLWAWRDLYGQSEHRRAEMTAQVVGLRAAGQKRANRPGIVPRPSRAWYGVALYSTGGSAEEQAMTFALSQEIYTSVREGDLVRVVYSPHLHFVYVLERVNA